VASRGGKSTLAVPSPILKKDNEIGGDYSPSENMVGKVLKHECTLQRSVSP
jgi:hypothetical protein